MHITALCPFCRTAYQVQATLRGQLVRCPSAACRKVFPVPEDVPPMEPPAGIVTATESAGQRLAFRFGRRHSADFAGRAGGAACACQGRSGRRWRLVASGASGAGNPASAGGASANCSLLFTDAAKLGGAVVGRCSAPGAPSTGARRAAGLGSADTTSSSRYPATGGNETNPLSAPGEARPAARTAAGRVGAAAGAPRLRRQRQRHAAGGRNGGERKPSSTLE